MRILLVDDHTLFRETLMLLLQEFYPASVVISASSSEEALGAVTHYTDLDLILLDLGLPGVDGLVILPRLLEQAPTVPVVVVSANEDPQIIGKALSSGAAGFIPKTTSSEEMKNALCLILAGEIYVPPAILGLVSFEQKTFQNTTEYNDSGLTRRQLEVLELLSLGLPNKSIANRLNLTEGTVKLHVTAIMRKLGAHNRTEAVREASHRGLLISSSSSL